MCRADGRTFCGRERKWPGASVSEGGEKREKRVDHTYGRRGPGGPDSINIPTGKDRRPGEKKRFASAPFRRGIDLSDAFFFRADSPRFPVSAGFAEGNAADALDEMIE